MKKIVIVSLLFLLVQTAVAADRLLMLSVAATYMRPNDTGFRSVYGNSAFFPDISVGVRVLRGLHVVGGYGWLSKSATSPNLNLDEHASQSFFSAGVAYVGPIKGIVHFDVEGGYVYARYKEEAFGTSVSGGTSGLKADAGILLMAEEGQIFGGFKVGYTSAKVGNPDIKLGGFRVALCIGLRMFGADY